MLLGNFVHSKVVPFHLKLVYSIGVGHLCHGGVCVEVSGQLVGVSCPSTTWSRLVDWQQAPLPAEPAHQLRLSVSWMRKLCLFRRKLNKLLILPFSYMTVMLKVKSCPLKYPTLQSNGLMYCSAFEPTFHFFGSEQYSTFMIDFHRRVK